MLPRSQPPGLVKSQSQVPVAQPVYLRRLQRQDAQCRPSIAGTGQRASRGGTGVCDPLRPAQSARKFCLGCRPAKFCHGLLVTVLTNAPVPVDLLKCLASGPAQANEHTTN